MRVLYVLTSIDRGELHSILGLHAAGVEVVAVCHPDSQRKQALSDAGIPVHPLAFRSRRDSRAIAELRSLIKAVQPDIVHVFAKRTLSNCLVALKGLRPRLIAYRGIVGNLSYLDPTSWMSFLHPRIDRIICVAEAIRQDLLNMRFFGLHIPPHKVVTIHKGHKVEWYTQGAKADLTTLGIPAGSPVVGCVANMRPRKGIPVLIKAFESLPNDLGAHLLLVGNIDDRQVERLIARSRLRDRIHAVGFQTDAPALAGALDVFVLPTLRREGLPKTVIEAMAQAVPAIVTNAGGSPELIEDGISGRIVPPGSVDELMIALVEILSDPSLAKRYGAAAQVRIRECFNVEQTVRKTLAVYNGLLMPDYTHLASKPMSNN